MADLNVLMEKNWQLFLLLRCWNLLFASTVTDFQMLGQKNFLPRPPLGLQRTYSILFLLDLNLNTPYFFRQLIQWGGGLTLFHHKRANEYKKKMEEKKTNKQKKHTCLRISIFSGYFFFYDDTLRTGTCVHDYISSQIETLGSG